MRIPLLLLLALAFSRCASPPSPENLPQENSERSGAPPAEGQLLVSPLIRDLITIAKKKGYFVLGDTFSFPGPNNRFSLVNPDAFLGEKEWVLMQQGASAKTVFGKRNSRGDTVKISLEEFRFLSYQDANRVQSALFGPVSSPSENRFLSRPFILWIHESSLFHIFTPDESGREAMDSLQKLLVEIQSPELPENP
jgi:hypothetical protein